MRKKILSMLLVLCMVCTMLPVTSMAEEAETTIDGGGESIASIPPTGQESLEDTGNPEGDMLAMASNGPASTVTGSAITCYDIWVGGVRVTSENMTSVTGSAIIGDIHYIPDTNTLYLNDAAISEAYEETNGNMYGIYSPSSGLNLVLSGEHSSVFVQGTLDGKDSVGIYSNGDLTISGTGKLVAAGGTTIGDHGDSYGIHVENGNLTVEAVELIATGAPVTGSGSSSHGICIHDGNMTIKDNGVVSAEGAESDSVSYGVCIHGSNTSLTVENGSSLTATGGETEGVSYGIYFEDGSSSQLNVNGKLTATGGSAVDESCGIVAGSVLVGSGANLEAFGASATTGSFGISSGNITIEGGMVEASSSAADRSQAMTCAPVFGSSYNPLINAGVSRYFTDFWTVTDFNSNIDQFRYVEIEPDMEYDLWVGGVRVTSRNKYRISGEGVEGYISYNPEENTLTLYDAYITEAYDDVNGNSYGIYAPSGDLKLKLLSNRCVIFVQRVLEDKDTAGIYVNGNLTVFGDGKLVVIGGITEGAHGDSYGVHVENGNLIVEAAELTATGSYAGGSGAVSYGICVHDGNMIIKDNGNVLAEGDMSDIASYGVYLGGSSLFVESGSSLEAKGSYTEGVSYGIHMDQDNSTLTVDGKVTAISSAAVDESCAILAKSVIVGDGANLEAIGGFANGASFGISSDIITISGSKVVISSGGADVSKAMTCVPVLGSYYIPVIIAGDNAAIADYATEEELRSNIDTYRYVEIEPYTEYDLWVGGVRVNSLNKLNIIGEGMTGYIAYDSDENTLILYDVTISEAYDDWDGNRYGIYAPSGDLKLELIGERTNIFVQGTLTDRESTGIYVNGDLTVFGEGTLVVTGGATTGDHSDSYGIHIENGDLTVETVELIASSAPMEGTGSASYGICVHDGNMFVRYKGSVTANGAESDIASYGVYLGGSEIDLVVESGSSLTATGGDTDGVSYGIHMEKEANTLIVDGKVTAVGGAAVSESCGILAYMIGVNADAILEASGRSATTASFGICSNRIYIHGGKVEVDSSEANVSRAMTSVPFFESSYTHLVNAGLNGQDAFYMTDEGLEKGISRFRYIEITPNTSVEDNDGGASYTPAPAPTTKPTEAVDIKTEIKASVDSDGSASISIMEEDILKAISNAKAKAAKNGVNAGKIKLDIHVSTEGKDTSDYSVNLSQAALQQLIDNGIAGMEVTYDDSAITLGISQEALEEINRQASADVQISISRANQTDLSTAAQKAIGDRPVYNFRISDQNGNRNVSNFGNGRIYVSIPYTPADHENVGYLYILYVDEKGNTSRVMDSTYDAGSNSLIFATNHFSVYGVGYEAPAAEFTDISSHWAEDSINYVVARGLLSGTGKTTFSPDKAITRAELVMALGKLAGIDVEEYSSNSFKDVKAKSAYRPYIEWATSKDILKGTDEQKFIPDRYITREEIAAVMVNFAKVMGYELAAVRSADKYADASGIRDIYTEAVKTVQQAGILMGKANNKFDPKANVSRAELSIMIHRLIKLTINPTSAQGWTVNDDGQYMYYKNSKLISGWQTIDGVRYYFNTDGTLKTGWVKDEDGNVRYYSGKQMLVGFWNINVNGSSRTFYFDDKGYMVAGKWLKIDEKEYYFNADGALHGMRISNLPEADEKGVKEAQQKKKS